MSAMFRSLRVYNYRLWFAGAVVSNTGAWMQRTAQDWIVLTDLTNKDAVALGITMALQFGPMLVMVPFTGLIADRFDRRRTLMVTQTSSAVLAIALGVLVLSGTAQLWMVYVFALLLGVVTAIDTPVRQTFVSELVSDADLSNAVALNSTSFQSARLVGPAVAGLLIASVGSGWVFLINGLSYAGVLLSLFFIRRDQLVFAPRLRKAKGQIRDGLRYVRSRPDLIVVLTMVFIVGTFGFNFPIFISTMSTVEFGQGATEFGLLSSIMAAGAVTGSLLAARREKVRLAVILLASGAFGIACLIAAYSPTLWFFAVVLIFVGASSLTMMNTANAYVQTTTDPALRGRVMALYMAIFAGGTPIGAPIVGWVANAFGARWALGIGAASGIVAALIAVVWLVVAKGMRLGRSVGPGFGLRLRFDGIPADDRELATQEISIVQGTTERTS